MQGKYNQHITLFSGYLLLLSLIQKSTNQLITQSMLPHNLLFYNSRDATGFYPCTTLLEAPTNII